MDTPVEAQTAVMRALHMALGELPGEALDNTAHDLCAELGEQGYALVPVSPVSGTIFMDDPIQNRRVTYVFHTYSQFEYARMRVVLAAQRDRVVANQGALGS
jgi:hypothetical protein